MKRLSAEAGLNSTAVRDIMNGKSKNPRIEPGRALAGALRVTVSELIGELPIAPGNVTKFSDEDREWVIMARAIPREHRAEIRPSIAAIGSDRRLPILLPKGYPRPIKGPAVSG